MKFITIVYAKIFFLLNVFPMINSPVHAFQTCKKLLVYSEKGHLLPNIEKVLKAMKYYPSAIDTTSEIPYFTDVTLLNVSFLNRKFSLEFWDLVEDVNTIAEKLREFSKGKAEISFAESIAEKFQNFNTYLHLQSELNSNLFEFKAFYTEGIKFSETMNTDNEKQDIRKQLFNDKTKYFGFFINVESKNYYTQLKYYLHLNISNSMPEPKVSIKSLGHSKEKDNTFYYGRNDPIRLQLLHNIITPEFSDQNWQITAIDENLPTPRINEKGFKQEFTINRTGRYKIYCSVNDQIHLPVIDTIELNIVNKPELIIPKNMFSSHDFKIPFQLNFQSGSCNLSAYKISGPPAVFEKENFKDSLDLIEKQDILFKPGMPIRNNLIQLPSLKDIGTYDIEIVGNDGYFNSNTNRILLKKVPKRHFQVAYFGISTFPESHKIFCKHIARQVDAVPMIMLFDRIQFSFAKFYTNVPDLIKNEPGLFLSCTIYGLERVLNRLNKIEFPFYYKDFEILLGYNLWLYYVNRKTNYAGAFGIELSIWYKRLLFISTGVSTGQKLSGSEDYGMLVLGHAKFGFDWYNFLRYIFFPNYSLNY